MNPQVSLERWVLTDFFALPLSRALKLKFLTDLHTYLPANYSRLILRHFGGGVPRRAGLETGLWEVGRLQGSYGIVVKPQPSACR